MGDRPHQLVYPKGNYRGGIRPRREHGYRLYIDFDRNGVDEANSLLFDWVLFLQTFIEKETYSEQCRGEQGITQFVAVFLCKQIYV